MDKKNILIAVAWPYVNGELHIGHGAGYLIPADIEARFQRAIGNDVLMVSGSDCYGTPITVEADKRGVTPKEIADEYHAKGEKLLLQTLGLSYDKYTRTDTDHHAAVVQDIFLKLFENGYVSINTTRQFYSEAQKKFLPDRYVEGTCNFCGYEESRSDQCDRCGHLLTEDDLSNPKSKLTKDPVTLKDTQHYFVDWPQLQDKIREFVESKGPDWKNWIYQETLGWFAGKGLKPRAITRDLDWGVPLPVDRIPKDNLIEGVEHKRIYVWFDAVIGYLSASMLWAKDQGKPESWRDYWYNSEAKHYYFMGKDNLPFHTIFWPGQLIGAFGEEIHTPDVESINMFLDLEGQKFSKSRGITLPMADLSEYFGNDAIRFYVTWIMPETKDSSFSWTDFVSVNNDLLIGSFGNFINRSLSMANGFDMESIKKQKLEDDVETRIGETFTKARHFLDKAEFRNYLNEVLLLSDFGNKYVDKYEVYRLKKTDPEAFALRVKQMYAMIVALAYLVLPLMPEASAKILSYLDLEPAVFWPAVGKEAEQIITDINTASNSPKPAPIFRKLLPENIEEFKAKLQARLASAA
jgi:methionyl-tRNA synthetase